MISSDFFMFDIGDGPTPENKCSSLIQCFSTLVSLVSNILNYYSNYFRVQEVQEELVM